MKLKGIIGLFLIVSTLTSAQDISQETRNNITHHLENAQKRYGIFGQSLAVLKDGNLVYLGSTGQANIEFNIPTTPETTYSIYSVTKLFISIRLLQLAEQKKINLNDSLGQHFPEIPGNWKDITILQALSHISGIPEYSQETMTHLTGSEAISYVADLPMEFKAGEKSSYNQTNFYYIQKLIEKFDATNIENSIKQNVIIPHKLTNTNFGGEFDIVLGRATRYEGTANGNKRVMRNDPPPYYYAANGMNSNVKDIAIWFQALLTEQFISTQYLENIWKPIKLNNGNNARHTHGWEVRDMNGFSTVGHYGGNFVNVRHFYKDDIKENSVTIIHITNGSSKGFNAIDLSYTLASEALDNMKTPLRTLKEKMLRYIEANKWEQANNEYFHFKKRYPSETLATEDMINHLGYTVMSSLGAKKAIPVFDLNTKEYPNSSNAYDSLAEAYLNNGNKNKAMTFYQKALTLNKGNQRIKNILESLNK